MITTKTVIVFGVIVVLALAVVADEAAKWNNRPAVELAADNNPAAFVSAVELVCTQKQLDQIEAALVVTPTGEAKKEKLTALGLALQRLGYKDTDAVVIAVKEAASACAAGGAGQGGVVGGPK